MSFITNLEEYYENEKINIIKEQQEKILNEIKKNYLKLADSEKYLSRISQIDDLNSEHKQHYEFYFTEIEKVLNKIN